MLEVVQAFDRAKITELASDDAAALKAFQADHRGASATDRDGAPVFMAKDVWEVGYVTQRHPAIRFTATKERRFAPVD